MYGEWIGYCEMNGMTAHEFLCVSCPLIAKCKGAQYNELTVILSIYRFTLLLEQKKNTGRAEFSVNLVLLNDAPLFRSTHNARVATISLVILFFSVFE